MHNDNDDDANHNNMLEYMNDGFRGNQGYGLSVVRIGNLIPRTCLCVVSCLAILRIEGCLNSTR